MGLWSRNRPALTAAATPTASSSPADGVLRAGAPGSARPAGLVAEAWQWDIYGYYDTAGPLKFAAMYKGNIARRCKLRIGVRPEDDPEGDPIRADDINDPDKPDVKPPAGIPLDLINQAVLELARIRDPVRGQSGILYDAIANKTVAGDCRLVVEPDPRELNGERWQIYSVIELRMSGTWPSGAIRWTEVGPPSRELAEGSIVWRLHRPHIGRHKRADSSSMGILAELEELSLVRRGFRVLAKSRVSGSGLFVFPKELGLKPADPEKPEGPTKLAVDMVRHMSEPLKNEDSAANLVPHFLEGPADLIGPDYIRHIPFVRPADQLLDTREDKAIKGIATGVDIPPEIVLGIGNTNHWNAAQVTEDTWKAHGEPDMIELAQQLACMPLRDLLASHRLPAPDGSQTLVPRWDPQAIARIVIVVDPSAVIEHPDHGKDAQQLHDRWAISDAALRRANSFDDSDAPDEAEIAARVERERLIKARGSMPEVLPEADITGPGEYPPGPPQPPLSTPQPPQDLPPQPSGPSGPSPSVHPMARVALAAAAGPPNPGQRMATLDMQLMARLHTAAQATVRRNLEKAGARIVTRTRSNQAIAAATRGVPPHLVAATVGQPVLQQVGVTDAELAMDFNDYLDDADNQAARARAAGLAALLAWLKANGRPAPTDGHMADWQAKADRAQAAGRAVLAAGLTAFAASELFTPHAEDTRGEGVAAGTLPPAVIRQAVAAYGGQDLAADGRSEGAAPLRGVAGGALNLGLASQLGATASMWQWVHGSPEHPFEPHEWLDGQIFGEGDDTSRANTADPWLGTSDYYPGDHEGCTCFALPLLGFNDSEPVAA